MNWTVYLSGEIHTDWRDRIREGATSRSLPVTFSSAVTDHAASDAAGDVRAARDDACQHVHCPAALGTSLCSSYCAPQHALKGG